MIQTKYDPENDMLTIEIQNNQGNWSETVDFKEFMDGIPTQRARIEYLLSMIADVRKKRLTDLNKFMKKIEELTVKIAGFVDRMEQAASAENYKMVGSLEKIVKSILNQKNTLRELRYAIKLLEMEEGKLKAQMLEVQVL